MQCVSVCPFLMRFYAPHSARSLVGQRRERVCGTKRLIVTDSPVFLSPSTRKVIVNGVVNDRWKEEHEREGGQNWQVNTMNGKDWEEARDREREAGVFWQSPNRNIELGVSRRVLEWISDTQFNVSPSLLPSCWVVLTIGRTPKDYRVLFTILNYL